MRRRLEAVIWILALSAALALLAGGANAVVCVCCPDEDNEYPPVGDNEIDGWRNTHECGGEGITPEALEAGLYVQDPNHPDDPNAWVGEMHTCWGNPFDPRDNRCMSPIYRDVFVWMKLLPELNWFDEMQFDESGREKLFSLTSKGRGLGGLEVAMHRLDLDMTEAEKEVWETVQPVRVVVDQDPDDPSAIPNYTQSALTITELDSLDGDYLGEANYGTPNNLDRGVIFTSRIAEFVNEVCPPTYNICEAYLSASGEDPEQHVDNRDDVIKMLALWVVNHETGHMFKLTRQFTKRFGGYHLSPNENAVMAQFPQYQKDKKAGRTTFFIPGIYHESSLADARFE